MAFVKIFIEDRYLGNMSIENSSIEEIRMCDDPKEVMRKELDTTVARVKEAYGISPNSIDAEALGRAASYVLTDPIALAMSQEQVGQAIIDRLAKSL